MPKTAQSDKSKVAVIVRQYPTEFQATPKNELYCKCCNTVVKHEKQFFVDKHRGTDKHKRLSQQPSAVVQQFIHPPATDYARRVVAAFLAADIPLWKLRNPQLRQLFASTGHPLPSDETCRSKVPELHQEEMARVKSILSGQLLFMIVDESEVSGNKYINILVGTLQDPQKSYMLECLPLAGSADAQAVIHAVDDAISSLGCPREDFCLLITDAATYMISAAKTLHLLYPRLFHITCLAHLLHNCAMKVRAHYVNVDNVIAHVKAITVKNKSRQRLFDAIGQPPSPILTRWATWLDAAFYYTRHLPQVRQIVGELEGDGVLLTRAKNSVKNESLVQDLIEIQQHYHQLSTLVMKLQDRQCTITKAVAYVADIDFGADPCGVGTYLKKRLDSNEIMSIANCSRAEISPLVYSYLHNCQATSAEVERSFSILNKLLAKDRHFLPANIRCYLTLQFNNATK